MEELCGLSDNTGLLTHFLPLSDPTKNGYSGFKKNDEMIRVHFAGQYTAGCRSGNQ